MSEADDARIDHAAAVTASGVQQPKHLKEVSILVETSALRILLIGTPTAGAKRIRSSSIVPKKGGTP